MLVNIICNILQRFDTEAGSKVKGGVAVERNSLEFYIYPLLWACT